jgi:hypothetical protein
MADIKYAFGSWTAGFNTSDMNSLASQAEVHSTLSSPHINNETDSYLWIQFECILGSFGSAPSAGGNIIAFLRPRDSAGSSFVDGAIGGTAATQTQILNVPHAVMLLRPTTGAVLVRSGLVGIPPGYYNLGAQNRSGQNLAASGNQINYRLVREQIV